MHKINGDRLLADLRRIADFGRYQTGVHRPHLSPQDVESRHWLAGRNAYADGRFADAIRSFEAAAAIKPGDGPCRVFIERCIEFTRDGVPAGWDGTWHFNLK